MKYRGKIADEVSNNKDLLAKIVAEEKYGLREKKLEDSRKSWSIYWCVFYIMGVIVPLTL